ncbi:MAG: DUF2066 domain-containing protein [Pseudomonadota bacterium]|nr:DUF2066 domain-containing protein [Pseudomonadota bacterium]
MFTKACLNLKILDLKRFVMPSTSNFRLFGYLVLLSPLLWNPFPSFGVQYSVYSVKGILLDETAESASAARDIALEKGQFLAYKRLIDKLVPIQEKAKLNYLAFSDLVELVSAMEIDKEKTSPIRYLASLKVQFNPTLVRRHLRKFRVRFAETVRKPLVILPVYRAQATLQLWDKANLWIKAWRILSKNDSLVSLIVPNGTNADIAQISPEQAIAGNLERLNAIAKRYRTTNVLLAIAELKKTRNKIIIKVTIKDTDLRIIKNTSILIFHGTLKENIQEVLVRAARASRKNIEETWKQKNILKFGEKRELLVRFAHGGLSQINKVTKKLQFVAAIERLDLLSLSLEEVLFRVQYFGDEAQLELALSQHDLELKKGIKFWRLKQSTNLAERND